MITFLLSPKPFKGYADIQQRNTIISSKAIHPDAEVIIYGDGEGISDVCKELQVQHVPDIGCAPSGIPYFNAIAEHANANAKNDILCYMNCDIILANDVVSAVKDIPFEQYMITGQRLDIKEGVEVDVTDPNCKSTLFRLVRENELVLHPATGMDYFIFRRGMWQGMLPVIIGRAGYDEALVLYCLRNDIPFINGTLSILAFHQFHDYGHQKGGKKTVFFGEEALYNYKVHKNMHSRPNSADAQWLLIDGDLIENKLLRGTLRKIEHFVRFKLKLEKFSLMFRFVWRGLVSIKLAKPIALTLREISDLLVKD